MKCLVFSIREFRFGIPLEDIERIVESKGKVFKLPLVPEFISGITNYQGRIITVIDLGLFFNSNTKTGSDLIVISNRLKHLGYTISRLEGFINVDENELEDVEKFSIDAEKKEYIKCIAKADDNRIISVIDLNRVERFFQNPKNWSYYEA